MGRIEFRTKTFGLERVRSDRVRADTGFPHGTGFGSQRVLGRHEFPQGSGFGSQRVSDCIATPNGFRNFNYAAMLRLPKSLTHEEKIEQAELIILEL
ncbi:hypothetical protein Hdeb2414_s0011g00369401 [Helianthus debilis subsp. tardiflorus]